MIYEIQGVVMTWGDLWRAEMCTNWALSNPYHHSAVKNHLYKPVETLCDTIQVVFGRLWCVLTAPTPTLPPIQILGTTHPNWLRILSHVIWCYTTCLDHPSWFLGGCGVYWWHPHPDPTTHLDIGNHLSKPAETFSPCYMMLYNVFGSP